MIYVNFYQRPLAARSLRGTNLPPSGGGWGRGREEDQNDHVTLPGVVCPFVAYNRLSVGDVVC